MSLLSVARKKVTWKEKKVIYCWTCYLNCSSKVKIYSVILELNLALHYSGQEAADALEADMIGTVLQEGGMLELRDFDSVQARVLITGYTMEK